MISFIKKLLKPKSRFPLPALENGYLPAHDGNKLTCPNCGSHDFYEGPEGGGSVNIQCVNCFKYYNYMGMFGYMQDIGDRSEIFGVKKPEEYLESPAKFYEKE